MNEAIVIKLKGSATAKKYEKDELFQIDKYREIENIFEGMLNEISTNCKKIENCRNHDTIFVDGERGAGKTAFLLNIETFLENKDIKKKIKIFRPIDPTLLEDNENFLSIIIARITEEVRNSNVDVKEKQSFFEILYKLSDSLNAIKSLKLKEEIGIDEIASYASSMRLEQLAHEFFKKSAEIFNVEKLVVLIDDVDMSFEFGYSVLEVIRKFLSSPFIIPVVAGDYRLYEIIISDNFRKKVRYYKEEFKDKIKKDIEILTNQYLQKVFPLEFRIQLDDIKSIIEKKSIKVKIDNEIFDLKDLIKFDEKAINCNLARERFSTIEYNTRTLSKYLFRKREFLLKCNKNIEINELKDSFRETYEFYKYPNDEEKNLLSILLKNDVDSFLVKEDSEKYSIYKAFKGLENILDVKEEAVSELFITKNTKNKDFIKNTLNNITLNGKEKLIVTLFSYNDYYTSYQKRCFLVGGKFLELVVFSFDSNLKQDKVFDIKIPEINGDLYSFFKNDDYIDFYNNIDKGKVKIGAFKNNLLSIFYSKPYKFKRVFKMDEGDNCLDIDEKEIEDLLKNIIVWNNVFVKKGINSVYLYRVLNKFFNNLEVMKNSDEVKKYSTVFDFFLRIVLILLNSFAYYENENSIVTNTNVGVSKSIDLKNFFEKDNSFRKNIKPLIEKESLIRAFLFHPIVHYLFTYEDGKLRNLVRDVKSVYEYENEKFKEFLEENRKDINDLRRTRKEILEFLKQKCNKIKQDFPNIEKIELFKKILNYSGNDESIKTLIEEIKKCFGIH